MKYTPVIGLEVHVELKTKSKMFCGCSSEYFGKEPNTHTCPVCLGMPGALPVPNKKAIEWCVMIGMTLGCDIPLYSKFDRKNYFYPDLPKGYQISQFDEPFAVNGTMKLSSGKTIRIKRVHMEEDTGKLTHATIDGQKVSLVDFNRSGLPLVEIVTEPDFDNATDVKEYLQRLQKVVRYLDVSNADMDKGDMRLEPNISLRKEGEIELPNYKVEVKNINSFGFVEKAITYEIKRQAELLDQGKRPPQETRGFNEDKNITVSQRSKEEAHDYRYFPEPDIPPFRWTKKQLEIMRAQMPELPDVKFERFTKVFQLPPYDAEILTRDKTQADYFEEAIKIGKGVNITAKQIANHIINKKIDTTTVSAQSLIEEIKGATQKETVGEKELEKCMQEVMKEHAKAVTDYKNGKETVIMFLVGQVMRKVGKKIDAMMVRSKLETLLKK